MAASKRPSFTSPCKPTTSSPDGMRSHPFELIAFGDYIELSVDGHVLLSLADNRYRQGAVGFYTESAMLRWDDMIIEELRETEGEIWGGKDSPQSPISSREPAVSTRSR